MPGPPTPVSGCSLKRVEIKDRNSTRAYNSTPPTNVFTLSIEAECLGGSQTGTLVLLIHNGQQQLVRLLDRLMLAEPKIDANKSQISLRLTDLLNSSPNATDLVTIDKQLLQLCIRIPQQSSSIAVEFENNRDFGVSVCLLKKSNFHITESITCILSLQPQPTPAPAIQQTVPTNSYGNSSFGPRLSSLPPGYLSGLYGTTKSNNTASHDPNSFTALLNSTLLGNEQAHIFRSSPSPPQPYHQPRMHSLPMYSDTPLSPADSSAFNMKFSPYNIFLGKNSDQLHRPRVGSPLKQSFNPGDLSFHQWSPSPEHTSPHQITTSSPNSHLMHTASPLASPLQLNLTPPEDYSLGHRAVDTFQHSLPLTPMLRTNSAPSYSSPSLISDEASKTSFRDLMPQPRDLPFASEPKQSSEQRKQSTPKGESPSGDKAKTKTSKTASAREKTESQTEKASGKLPNSSSSPKMHDSTDTAPPQRPRTVIKIKVKKNSDTIQNAGPENAPLPSRTKKLSPEKVSSPKEPKVTAKSSTKRKAGISPKRPTPSNVPSPPERQEPVPDLSASHTQSKDTTRSSAKRPQKDLPTETTEETNPQRRRTRSSVMQKVSASGKSHKKATNHRLSVIETSNALIQTSCVKESDSPSRLNSEPGEPLILLTDPDLLKEVNLITSRLLDQYENDIEMGDDDEARAKFYVEQIYAARWDFWYSKLVEMERGTDLCDFQRVLDFFDEAKDYYTKTTNFDFEQGAAMSNADFREQLAETDCIDGSEALIQVNSRLAVTVFNATRDISLWVGSILNHFHAPRASRTERKGDTVEVIDSDVNIIYDGEQYPARSRSATERSERSPISFNELVRKTVSDPNVTLELTLDFILFTDQQLDLPNSESHKDYIFRGIQKVAGLDSPLERTQRYYDHEVVTRRMRFLLLSLLVASAACFMVNQGSTCTLYPESLVYRYAAVDDVPSIQQAFDICGTNGTIIFTNHTFTIASVLNTTNLLNVDVILQGVLKFTDNIPYWRSHAWSVIYQNQVTAWLFGGTNVTLRGDGGWIDGNGQTWYTFSAGAANLPGRPITMTVYNSSNVLIDGLRIIQPQFWAFFVWQSQNVSLTNYYSNATGIAEYSTFNTDGFDSWNSDNILIENATITTDDDCVAAKGNTTNMYVKNVTCHGSTGVTIGSIGQYPETPDYVFNITFEDITCLDSFDCAYVKTWQSAALNETNNGDAGGGGGGLVKNVTFRNFNLQNVALPIQITQCVYAEGDQGCNSSNLALEDISWVNFTGTSQYNIAASLYCAADHPCPGITFKDVNIQSVNETKGLALYNTTLQSEVYQCANIIDQNISGIPCNLVAPDYYSQFVSGNVQ